MVRRGWLLPPAFVDFAFESHRHISIDAKEFCQLAQCANGLSPADGMEQAFTILCALRHHTVHLSLLLLLLVSNNHLNNNAC